VEEEEEVKEDVVGMRTAVCAGRERSTRRDGWYQLQLWIRS
jgi:uncharacterized protein (UPF0264 family)